VNSTAGTPDTEWQTYNYEFTAVAGQTDISWIGIASYGGYLIDELKITGADEDGATMQYIVNGSFSGAYLEGYTYGGNYNVAKQTDVNVCLRFFRRHERRRNRSKRIS